MELSQQQGQCVKHITSLLKGTSAPPLVRIDGFAGTGKSTILPFILEDLGYEPNHVAFVAPTGKAAKVMRTKLRAQRYPNCITSTIHSSIYRAKPAPVARLEADLAAHKEKLAEITQEIHLEYYSHDDAAPKLNLNEHREVVTQRKLIERLEKELDNAYDEDKLSFQINPDAAIQMAQLIVVDEFSMVGTRMADDLMSFGVPILAMGDPGQLPPVEDEDFLATFKPDFFLSEIHRQAADNPIIHLSKLAREGEDLPYGDYGNGVVVMDRRDYDYTDGFDNRPQFICGKNDTRWRITQMLRKDFGFTPNEREVVGPRKGEPVIVKKNHKDYPNLVNGSDCIARADFNLEYGKASGLFSFEDDEGVRYDQRMVFQGKFEEHFSRKAGKYTGAKPVTYRAIKRDLVMDWNYVITAHSSQGSQWDNVVVIDESPVFRKDANRWLYTAVTRAAESLIVLR